MRQHTVHPYCEQPHMHLMKTSYSCPPFSHLSPPLASSGNDPLHSFTHTILHATLRTTPVPLPSCSLIVPYTLTLTSQTQYLSHTSLPSLHVNFFLLLLPSYFIFNTHETLNPLHLPRLGHTYLPFPLRTYYTFPPSSSTSVLHFLLYAVNIIDVCSKSASLQLTKTKLKYS